MNEFEFCPDTSNCISDKVFNLKFLSKLNIASSKFCIFRDILSECWHCSLLNILSFENRSGKFSIDINGNTYEILSSSLYFLSYFTIGHITSSMSRLSILFLVVSQIVSNYPEPNVRRINSSDP